METLTPGHPHLARQGLTTFTGLAIICTMRESADSNSAAPQYEPPRVEIHGSVAEVTKAFIVGIETDAPNLPAGTSIFGHTSL